MDRRPTILIAALAASLVAAGPAAASQLPTHRELERRTAQFLADEPATRAAPGRATADAFDLERDRAVALYGAPQMNKTILGMKSVAGAARKLERQSAAYANDERPVVGAFDLVSVFATADRGSDNLYRSRQDDRVIESYLRKARATGARLILDIQPGRSTFVKELRALERWVVEPDVDVAIDAEWNVGPRGVPNETLGGVTAKEIRRVQKHLATIVRENDLPPKLLLVHQYRRGSVRGRAQVRQRPTVPTVLNFDGIGEPDAKVAGYEQFAAPQLFNGFSLFYRLDDPLMRPRSVLGLEPSPDFLLYQ